MKKAIILLLLYISNVESQEPMIHFSLDGDSKDSLEVVGEKVRFMEGVVKKSLALNGRSTIKLKSSTNSTQQLNGFTFVAWVNPHQLNSSQQMIGAKNIYSLGKREWSLMIDKDNRFSAYVRQTKRWVAMRSKTEITAGKWYLVGLTVNKSGQKKTASLWVNGNLAESVELANPISFTTAPMTLGGVDDNGRLWQNLTGAIDEVSVFGRPLNAKEMKASYRPVKSTHPVVELAKRKTLWTGGKIPSIDSAKLLKDVEFHVIKKWEPDNDGFKWLHGVALAWHKKRLYASFGHNKGAENTLTEEGRFCVSEDGGQTWSKIKTIDRGGDEKDLAVSHGVFLSNKGKLWAFLGSFYGTRKKVHTRAYTLDEEKLKWLPQGKVVDDGFWPMTHPVKMSNGNWIMPGFIVGKGNPPAVAISHGDNLMKWTTIEILPARELKTVWGESTIWVDGSKVFNIARYGSSPTALLAHSNDFARTWTSAAESNLPMAASKPCAGVLSDGRRYLICSTTLNGGNRRSPLTIALSKKGENTFSEIRVIRHAVFPEGPGESNTSAALAYPYAIESDGKLFVGYSNSGGRGGNKNSAELAVIPLSSLK